MKRSAFTLIELLVVIAIIGVLSMGITMIQFGGSSQSIYSAQRSMMTAFYEARMTAITKHTDAMVIIYKGDDQGQWLRRIGVIYKVFSEDNLEMGWVALNQGFTMPKNTFYVPTKEYFSKYIKLPATINSDEIYASTFNSGITGAYNVIGIEQFPSNQAQFIDLGSGDWFSYGFSSDGMSLNPGAHVMLALGTQDGAGKFLINNPYDQLGFVVRRLGNTIAFSGYDEMEETLGKQK